MKKIFAILILVFSSTGFAASGSGGGLASVAFFKFDQETEGPQIGNTKSINTYYDLKLGYVFATNIYVGGIYSIKNEDNGTTQPKRTLYGATLGYHQNGGYLDLSYFVDGKWDLGSIEFEKASGIGADLGYQYLTNSNLFIGVQLSYKSLTFKEYTASNITVTEDNKLKSELYPMLVGGVMF